MDFWELLGLAEDKQKEKPAADGKFLSTKVKHFVNLFPEVSLP
jgi:hypothetical protein